MTDRAFCRRRWEAGWATRATRNPSQKGFTFDAGDLNHPIVAPFRGNPNAGLERAVTLEYFQVKVPPGSPSRVVLRFDSGDPAIVERQVGLGRSVLVTTSADVSWSTWPVHPTFPPIIHEIVRFAAGGRSQERQRLIGEPLIRTLSSRETAAQVVVKTPDGSEHTLRPVQNEKKAEAVFSETGTRGIYEMTIGPAATSKTPLADAARGARPPSASNASAGQDLSAQAGRRELFAVNVDTHESDLETVDEKTLRSTTLAGIPFVRRSEWSESPRDLADAATARSGLASWLLVAVLALLLVEPLLAWSFRHGFILLCTLALCGLAAPWVPRNAWGGLIIAVLLAGGVVAVLLFGQERRSARIVSGDRASFHRSSAPVAFRSQLPKSITPRTTASSDESGWGKLVGLPQSSPSAYALIPWHRPNEKSRDTATRIQVGQTFDPASNL